MSKKHNNYAQQKKKGNIQPGCNCRDKFRCPLNGKYRTENIIYKCTSLNESNLKKIYLVLAEETFKTDRYYDHQQSCRNQKYSKSPTLSAHLWNIKRTSNEFIYLKWEILQQVASFSNISKRSLMLAWEVSYIEPDELLNKRAEIISKCRHQNKLLSIKLSSNN